VSGLTLLNLFAKRATAKPAVAKPAGRSFEPLAGSAFCALGLAATASQREVFDAASSVRLALKLGVQKNFESDLPWLAPVSRTESDVRDALSRLSEPAGRAFERLFWFHAGVKTEPASNVAELRAGVDALLSDDSPAALHDAALLALAGLLRLDPALEDAEAWGFVFKLWHETVEREEFWSLLVAADLNGEYEQSVTFGEVRRLRLRTPRLVSAPVAEHAKDATLRGDLGACARAFAILRAGRLPAALLEEYERDTLGPAEDRLEEACDTVFSASALAGGFMPSESEAVRYNNAWDKFERKVKPQLRGIVEIGGVGNAYVRRALERAADKLRDLAERYRGIGLHGQSVTLLSEARSLAPPGCEALESIDAALLIQNPGVEVSERSFDDYAQKLARELSEGRVPPKLPRSYTLPAVKTEKAGGFRPVALLWLAMIVSCFALQRCRVINMKPSTTFPPANLRMMNLNYDTRFPMPQYKPVPPIVIPPYLMPSDNRNSGRRARRRGAQRRGTTDNTMTLNLNFNLSPPVIVTPPLNRNAASPSRNAPPRD